MKRKLLIVLFLFSLFFAFTQINSAEITSIENFGKIVIMENGRIKPIDTFADNILKQISGMDRFNKKRAIDWLVRVLLDPKKSHEDKVFLITNIEVLDSIGIQRVGKARNRYSYNQLSPGIEKLQSLAMSFSRRDNQDRDIIENEIIALFNKLYVYKQLTASFKFLDQNENSFSGSYADLPLTIIPGDKDNKKWISGWDSYILNSKDIKKSKKLLALSEIYNSYKSGDQNNFDKSINGFKQIIIENNNFINENKIDLEIMYNKVDPFYKSKFFFGFSILFLLLSFVYLRKWFYRLSFFLLSAGFVLTLLGTIVRMYIRSRPPVTNIYETIVFTGLITALLGIILELFKKKNIGIFTGSFASFVMLMIAGKYALDGDNMGMLGAVLDSNFWLAFHVITIMLGYAGIVLSGVIGHIYIIQNIFKPGDKNLLKDSRQAVYSIQAFGIVFTFLGTVLGGIWADQSWGRFWGWDPKENGALLILIWSAILFHAKLAKMIKGIGFAFGSVIGVIFVALAWFGVNLLGVGLHSYGFTSGIAQKLFLFISIELIFIFITGSMLKFGEKKEYGSGL